MEGSALPRAQPSPTILHPCLRRGQRLHIFLSGLSQHFFLYLNLFLECLATGGVLGGEKGGDHEPDPGRTQARTGSGPRLFSAAGRPGPDLRDSWVRFALGQSVGVARVGLPEESPGFRDCGATAPGRRFIWKPART